jgi:hypothetical protein
MVEHTPTPWRFSPWHIEDGPPAVRAPEGWIVATTAYDADADFIARAANAHEALVRFAEYYERTMAVSHVAAPLASVEHQTARKLLDEALSLARGEQP